MFEGIELVDISNLALPVAISNLPTDGGAHNSTLIESTVYISNPSRDALDIVDVSDPRRPRVVRRVAPAAQCRRSPYPCQDIAQTDWDPHDVTAQTRPDKGHRLYVGAIAATFILDVNDPHKVRVVSKIPNGDFEASYQNIEISHQADPSPDGRLLVVSDERGGGVSETTCPGGGLHVYDITSEAPGDGELDNSAVKPGQKTTWGRTMGFAIMPGADTWAAKAPGLTAGGRLFLYTDDIVRGMDVFEYTGALPPPAK